MRRRAAALGALLLATACTSTAGPGATRPRDRAGRQASAPPGPVRLVPLSPPGAPTAPPAPPAHGGTPASAGTTTSTGSRPGSAAAGLARFGPGVTATEIRIGVTLQPNNQAFNAAAGWTEATRADVRRVWGAAADALNAAGGIRGRRVVPVYHEIVPFDDAGTEKLCAHFTEDEPVLASMTGGWPDLQRCFERAGVVTIPSQTPGTTGTVDGDSSLFRDSPHLLAPYAIALDRLAGIYVAALHQQKFFSGTHKIGLITWDRPDYVGVLNHVLRPALRRLGLSLAAEALIGEPGADPAEIHDARVEVDNAMARFQQRGIDRLLSLDSCSCLLPEMTRAGYGLQYHPRYGVSTASGTEWETVRDQLTGAVGLGWMPWWDLQPEDALRTGNAAVRRCYNVMKARGNEKEFDNFNSATMTVAACDSLQFLKMSIEAGGPSITADSVVAGAERIGSRFESGEVLASRIGVGRHDGVAGFRLVHWETGCQCFRYTGPVLSAG